MICSDSKAAKMTIKLSENKSPSIIPLVVAR